MSKIHYYQISHLGDLSERVMLLYKPPKDQGRAREGANVCLIVQLDPISKEKTHEQVELFSNREITIVYSEYVEEIWNETMDLLLSELFLHSQGQETWQICYKKQNY